jgi:hypothetical protein
MSFRYDTQVGEQFLSTGVKDSSYIRQLPDGSLATGGIQGKYYEQVRSGNVFQGSVATGGIVLIQAAVTGNHPSLWNRAGSGYNVEIVSLELTWLLGATAPTALYWMLTANAGSQIGAAAPVITWTNVAPVNCLIGGAPDADILWSPAVQTYVAIPAFWKGTGIGLGTGAPTVVPCQLKVEYDGTMVLGPGNVISLCTQAATSTATYGVAVTYIKHKIT